MDQKALQKRIREARKLAPNVTTIVRVGAVVYGLRWVGGRMDVRVLRKG